MAWKIFVAFFVELVGLLWIYEGRVLRLRVWFCMNGGYLRVQQSTNNVKIYKMIKTYNKDGECVKRLD